MSIQGDAQAKQAFISGLSQTTQEQLGGLILGTTEQQFAVLQEFMESERHLIVTATAGSGKSFLLKLLAFLAVTRYTKIGVFAYNRSIATELTPKMPKEVITSTFHAWGQRIIKEYSPKTVTVVQHKRTNILKRMNKEWGLSKAQLGAVGRLAELSMIHLEATPEGLAALAQQEELDILNLDVAMMVKVIHAESLKLFEEKGQIDYLDMLYLPIKKGWGKGSMELQLIDEAQDFSRLQHKAVEHYAGKHGRIIYVGDPDQAIYVFSGGDKEGLSRAEDKLGALRMPLSVTFRCPKSHVDIARQFSDNIEAHPEAVDGEVRTLDLDDVPHLAQDGDLIMARTNQDIIRAALKLTQQGRTTQILGTSLSQLLEKDIKAALPFPFLHGDIEGRLMSHWRSGLEELYQRGLSRSGMKRRSEELADRLGVIGTLAAVCVQQG